MMLDKLKETPSDKILAIIAVIAFVIFILINQLVFAPLGQNVSPGILDFEFAWTQERVSTIFSAWGTDGMMQHTLGVYWDMIYIVGYGFFIFGCILLVSRRLSERLQDIGIYMSLTPLIAGIFDLIENMQLLVMLSSPTVFASYMPIIAAVSALIKFALLIVGIVFFFVALILLVISVIKKRKS